MRKAYKAGKMAELRAIYDAIGMDDFACNKYQDNVDSSHDQAHITNSESDAGGDS